MLDQFVDTDPFFGDIATAVRDLRSYTDMAVVEWIAKMREGMRQLEAYSAGMLKIRCEDLVASPVDSLSKILEFVELPADRKMMDYASRALQPHSAKSPYEISSFLNENFLATMRDLGYA